MKKVLFGLLFLLLVGGVAFADNTQIKAGDWQLSRDAMIYNETLGTANTVEAVTLTEPTVSINIQAIGGDVRMCTGGTTTEAYWTIGQDQTFFDHLALPFNDNKVLYFWTTSSASPEVQIYQVYR